MAKVKRFGQGGSSSDPKRYIKRGPNGAQPASKPPVYQKEVAIRKTSEVASPNSKGVSSSAKSTSIRPKLYEGELNGGELAKRTKSAGSIGRDAIEGERVVSNRGSSSASSTSGKNVSSPSSSSSSSRAVSPKVYEGEVSGSVPKSASGKTSGNVYEGERVSKPISKTSTISEGSYRELPKSTSSVASAKDKIVSGLEKSAKKVPAYEAIKGAAASKVDSSLGGMAARGLGRVAGPAAMAMGAKELYDSYKKYDELMPGTKPNMSKKSDSIVDAINSDSDASTRANSRAANREAIYGTQKSEPSTPAKKDEPVAVVKKQTTVVSKPKVSAPAKSSRNSMADEWAAFSKGREADTAALKDITDRYSKTGTLVNPEDENAYTKSVAGEESEYKKGGMTKRPPKPAKKVPPRKFASGGSTSRSSASSRGDGCATKGHTKGKYL
jgi:hypothetical protein